MPAHKRDATAPLDSLLKQSALITADMPDRSFLSKSWCLRTYNLDFCGERTHNLDRGGRNGWTHHTKVSWELFCFILAWPTLALWSEGLNQDGNLRWNCIGIPKACSSLSGCILDQPKRPSMFWQFYLWVYSHLPNSDNLKKGSLHKWAALTTTSAAAEISLIVVAELCSIMHKETVNPRQTNQSLQRGNDWGCFHKLM